MSKFLVMIVLIVGFVLPASAQSRLCNPFTTTPDPGMLALGTNVQFQRDGQLTNGVIVAYYIQSCFPGVPIIGQDPQAYVVSYGAPNGQQTVLNASALQKVNARPAALPVAAVSQTEETPILDGFHWFVDCQEDDDSGHHVWVGYSSSEALPDAYLAYIGNGPGIYIDTFEAGEHRHAVDVLTDYGDVTLWEDPDHVEITITAETEALDCGTF